MTAVRNDWQVTRLGEIADFRNGVNYTKENFGRGVKVINVKDFQDYTTPKYDTLDEINPDGAVRAAHLLQENDVIFVRSNGNRELIGRSLALLAVPPEPMTHSAFTIRVRLHRRPELNPRFYAYVFRSNVIRQVLSAEGNGANISNLNQDILERLVVPLPPRPQQDRIATILSAYDDLIQNNTRRIAILEEMARRLYEEWFVHFRFPGHEEAEFDGELPKGWSIGQLSDIAALVGRSMNPGNLPDQTYAHFSFPAFDVSAAPEVVRGEAIMSNKLQFTGPVVLLAKLNPRIERVWPVLQDHEAPMVASTEFVPLAPREGSSVSMIEAVVRSRGFRDYLLGLAGGTSTSHQRVKPKEVLAAQVPLAPPELWARASVALDPLLSQRDALRRKNANLRAQRDMLLPKLISGEIDVSGAEELLEAAE